MEIIKSKNEKYLEKVENNSNERAINVKCPPVTNYSGCQV